VLWDLEVLDGLLDFGVASRCSNPMSIADYEATYSGMSDDEILHLACEASGLREEARSALNSELNKRNLTGRDVSEYGQRLASIKPGEMAENQKYLARSFMGFGTSLYGKRDFRSDGSYTTTKWVTLFWVPVLPLGSLRVGKVRTGSRTGEPRLSKHYVAYFFSWTTKYWVYSEELSNQRQVLFVYAFVLALIVTVRSTAHISPKVSLVLLGSLCIVPWLIRKMATRPSG
jgi:hypothetical protein